MNLDCLLKIVDWQLIESQNRPLNSAEILILRGIWQYQTYNQNTSPCYPSGSLPLDSPFYLERSSIEEQVYQEIRKPGALIRIKACREMGKTSLLLRIIDYAKRLNYRTVSLNLEQVDQAILS
ncbi:MAG: AAA-like domain-containing protein [Prochloraceae cyanobacterium]|nr:AAA-like domain-containing protein [Prochloraceae cyanobacterium]